MRRQNTKFGGVPYPIQKCAAAIYSQQGKIEVENVTRLYSERARFLAVGLQKLGFTIYGGIDAPYIWCKTPNGITSWDFFDLLLEQASIITVPGCGFGQAGKGFIRLSAFAEPTAIAESLLRIKTCKP
jgi:LL-diaminopimelate aminotransferase